MLCAETDEDVAHYLGTAFGKIRKWFSDLKALAFKEKVAKEDLAETLKKELDAKADKTGNIASATKATQDSVGQQINTTYIKGLGINGKVITYTKGNGTTGTITTQDTTYNEATLTSAGLLSADDKAKLDGITPGANKYTHPTSAAGAKTSGLYKITTDDYGHITAATLVTKADITALGIPGQDTNTVYTHPTGQGNKHIPSGGLMGQYLKYSAPGNAAWASPDSN